MVKINMIRLRRALREVGAWFGGCGNQGQDHYKSIVKVIPFKE